MTRELGTVHDHLARIYAEDAQLRELLCGPEAVARRLEVHELMGRSARRLFEASKLETDPAKKQRYLDLANQVLRGEVSR